MATWWQKRKQRLAEIRARVAKKIAEIRTKLVEIRTKLAKKLAEFLAFCERVFVHIISNSEYYISILFSLGVGITLFLDGVTIIPILWGMSLTMLGAYWVVLFVQETTSRIQEMGPAIQAVKDTFLDTQKMVKRINPLLERAEKRKIIDGIADTIDTVATPINTTKSVWGTVKNATGYTYETVKNATGYTYEKIAKFIGTFSSSIPPSSPITSASPITSFVERGGVNRDISSGFFLRFLTRLIRVPLSQMYFVSPQGHPPIPVVGMKNPGVSSLSKLGEKRQQALTFVVERTNPRRLLPSRRGIMMWLVEVGSTTSQFLERMFVFPRALLGSREIPALDQSSTVTENFSVTEEPMTEAKQNLSVSPTKYQKAITWLGETKDQALTFVGKIDPRPSLPSKANMIVWLVDVRNTASQFVIRMFVSPMALLGFRSIPVSYEHLAAVTQGIVFVKKTVSVREEEAVPIIEEDPMTEGASSDVRKKNAAVVVSTTAEQDQANNASVVVANSPSTLTWLFNNLWNGTATALTVIEESCGSADPRFMRSGF